MAFNRVVSLTVGKDGQQGIEITGLHMAFTVKKSDTETKNEATIDVWNINPDTFALLQEPDTVIILKAGYEDEGGARPIFFGGIKNVDVDKSSPDWKYTIYSLDGYRAPEKRRISMSFAGGTSKQIVFDKVVQSFNLSIGRKKDIPGKFEGGFTYIGYADDAINKILDGTGLKARVHNELIYILEENERVSEFKATPETGLLGRPELHTEDDRTYWTVRTVLYTDIVPGMTLNIESQDLSGAFPVAAVEYKGDTHGEEFVCTIEVDQ